MNQLKNEATGWRVPTVDHPLRGFVSSWFKTIFKKEELS
jgi:hypothetical protein